MTGRPNAVKPLSIRHPLFCGADATTMAPRLVVEAESLEQARRRVRHVVEWLGFGLGFGPWRDFAVLEFKGQVAGLPTFFSAFFAAWERNESGVAAHPGTGTRH